MGESSSSLNTPFSIKRPHQLLRVCAICHPCAASPPSGAGRKELYVFLQAFPGGGAFDPLGAEAAARLATQSTGSPSLGLPSRL